MTSINELNEIEDKEWVQYSVCHCPNKNCRGMLLQNQYVHEMKCSDCKKYWIFISEFKEIQ